MLRLTLRKFSIAALSAAVGLSSAAATAQFNQLPGLPRKDTTRSNDEKPGADSRAGGALSVDSDPIEGAEIIDGADVRAEATDGDIEPRVGAAADSDAGTRGTEFSGLVTGVAKDRITVQMGPPRVPRATEQIFKVSTRTPVLINGQKSTLAAVKKGQFVRLMTMPGDPGVAGRIVVATPPTARDDSSANTANMKNRPPRSEPAVAVTPAPESEDQDQNFDVFPDKESAQAKPARQGRGRTASQNNEEAVLPLGIEVYGPGEGALVTEMLAEGPAARAGVQIGDFITEVNHQPVGDPEVIEQLMTQTQGSTGVVLTIMRDGKPADVTVEPEQVVEGSLTENRAIYSALAPYGFTAPVASGVVGTGAIAPGVAGAGVGLTLPLGGTLTDFAGGGALLTGQANQLVNGLQPNDVITGVNGQPIQNGDALIDALRSGQTDFQLNGTRNGQPFTTNIPRSALINAATQRTGAQRATGTLSGTTAAGPSGPLQRATGTLNGRVGTDQSVNEALNGANNNVAPPAAVQQRALQQRSMNRAGNAAAGGAAARNAAARNAAAAGNAAAGGAGVTGAAAATGGTATGAAATGGAATGGAATGGAAAGGAATGGATNPQ